MEVDAAAAAAAAAAEVEGAALRGVLEGALEVLQETVPPAEFNGSLVLLAKISGNVAASPADPKFRTIKATNAKFAASLGRYAAARQLLRTVGFVDTPAADATSERAWVLPPAADLTAVTLLASLAAALAAASAAPPSPRQAPPPSMPAVPEGATSAPPPPPPPPAAAAPRAAARAGDGPPQQTLLQARVAALKAAKEAPREGLRVPRRLCLLQPGEIAPKDEPVLDDSVYELTESDLASMALSGPKAAEGSEIKTAAMREMERLAALRTYTHALVRVRLPGGLLMQAAYHPQEPVAHVEEEVAALLGGALRGRPFYLFTTPPRTVLDPAHSLTQAGLVPAATAILAWRDPLPPELAALAAPDGAPLELLTPDARALLGARSADGAAEVDFPQSAPTNGAPPADGGGGAAAKRPAAKSPQVEAEPGAANGAAGSSSKADGAANGKPKWLRM